MVFSESLAERIRQVLGRQRGLVERKMFGGVGFLLHGNLCVGIWKLSLIARLGAERAHVAFREPHVAEFDITGRPMRGWVMIEPAGIETDEQLSGWIKQSLEFVETLPRK